MSDDFYTMVDSGDPAPDNEHITGVREERKEGEQTTSQAPKAMYAALGYLAQNQACGATDLARAFGNSAPTWSRTLNDLAQAGLVIKHGQKYHLTELGAARVRAQS